MDDPRNLWQTQEVEEMKFSLEELRAKAAKFQNRIRRRNIREYLAALVVVVLFADFLWKTPDTIQRIGFALVIVGALYYIWHLWKWGAAKFLPADLGRADCLRFYRGELERQRDLLRGVWKWAILPIAPGLTIGLVYGIVTASPLARWRSVLGAAIAAAIIVVIAWLNQRAARSLDTRIAELNRDLASSV
jgi:hypothetical protein